MKNLLVIISILLSVTANAQQPKFDQFTSFVFKNLHIPQSIQVDCSWNYAVIKASTNNAGTIIKWECINNKTVPDSLLRAFKFLKGYVFDKKLKVANCSIIFYCSIENTTTCTQPAVRQYTPNEVIELVLECFKHQADEGPKTVVIYEPIIITILKPVY